MNDPCPRAGCPRPLLLLSEAVLDEAPLGAEELGGEAVVHRRCPEDVLDVALHPPRLLLLLLGLAGHRTPDWIILKKIWETHIS